MAAVQRKEPVGFIGLDDDDDHGFERAFGGFQRKGQGGDSADDRGGGGGGESLQDPTGVSGIWGMMKGGAAGFQSEGHRLDEVIFERQI